jgi:hypothetical protein
MRAFTVEVFMDQHVLKFLEGNIVLASMVLIFFLGFIARGGVQGLIRLWRNLLDEGDPPRDHLRPRLKALVPPAGPSNYFSRRRLGLPQGNALRIKNS